MNSSKKEMAVKNILWGVGNKLVTLLFPFIIRTIIIYHMDSLYLGLGNLFASILQILNLAELGIEASVVYCLYEPMVTDDTNRICAFLHYYKKIYRIIGFVILIVGICLMPFLELLIKGEYPPNINIYVIYLIQLVSISLTYQMSAYKSALLIAIQRVDIHSKILIVSNFLLYMFQIVLLITTNNYYHYIFMLPIFSVVTNILLYIVVKRKYRKYIKKTDILNQDKILLKNKVSALFIYKLGGVISKSADSLVISSFLGLTILSKYSNYFYIITMLFGFFSVYYNAIRPLIGNTFITKKSKCLELFKNLFFVQAWMVGWVTVCLICLYQTFMKIWCGTNLLLDDSIVILLVVYFYTWKIQDTVYIFKEAVGLWDKDKIRPLVSAIVNLLLNIYLVRLIGLKGVLLSTIFSFVFIDLPWSCRIFFKECFYNSTKYYYKQLVSYTFTTLFNCIITWNICHFIGNEKFSDFCLKLLVCLFVPNIIFYICYRQKSEFLCTMKMIFKINN